MNVVLGTCTTNPRLSSSSRHPPTQRPPRPGSTSPRHDRRMKKKHHDPKVSKSTECSPRQLSPNCDPCQTGIGFLSISELRNNPVTQASSSQKKKQSSNHAKLSVDDSNISRSPSAPNLHATATSMLAFQGSMTAFTAIVAGKSQASQESSKAPKTKMSQQRNHVLESRDNQHEEITEPPKITVQEQTQIALRQNAMSPVPRLTLHTHVPENVETSTPDSGAWQRQRINPTRTEVQTTTRVTISRKESRV